MAVPLEHRSIAPHRMGIRIGFILRLLHGCRREARCDDLIDLSNYPAIDFLPPISPEQVSFFYEQPIEAVHAVQIAFHDDLVRAPETMQERRTCSVTVLGCIAPIQWRRASTHARVARAAKKAPGFVDFNFHFLGKAAHRRCICRCSPEFDLEASSKDVVVTDHVGRDRQIVCVRHMGLVAE
ncbi:conserved hypothetical protein [Ricinus communis]|uniref:Uncharacterized protein n=1 Tax=Ricinus communis TaxID=3988 RepID=B9TGJ7_RICCO|nr:conserved hypothetical protein [Ricinus communis]